jgi:peptidoglycan/xylan/chitin deacetylase (PgdA/CDA1 family)
VIKSCSFLIVIFSTSESLANNAAVILQYHHVSDDIQASTSVSPSTFEQHIEWLQVNQFLILPLAMIINTLENQKNFKQTKVLALTFDDANRSICDIAWPILKKY